jgi:hypothetical protein
MVRENLKFLDIGMHWKLEKRITKKVEIDPDLI